MVLPWHNVGRDHYPWYHQRHRRIGFSMGSVKTHGRTFTDAINGNLRRPVNGRRVRRASPVKSSGISQAPQKRGSSALRTKADVNGQSTAATGILRRPSARGDLQGLVVESRSTAQLPLHQTGMRRSRSTERSSRRAVTDKT